MRLELIPLADAVLPLIRSTSRDLWRYSAANDQGYRMHDGVELLERAIDDPAALVAQGIQTPTPQQVYTVVHKALASSIRVIARADDSSGIIGDACQRLIDLHPRAAARAGVSPAKLADWVYRGTAGHPRVRPADLHPPTEQDQRHPHPNHRIDGGQPAHRPGRGVGQQPRHRRVRHRLHR